MSAAFEEFELLSVRVYIVVCMCVCIYIYIYDDLREPMIRSVILWLITVLPSALGR